jgi:hypothetical protein
MFQLMADPFVAELECDTGEPVLLLKSFVCNVRTWVNFGSAPPLDPTLSKVPEEPADNRIYILPSWSRHGIGVPMRHKLLIASFRTRKDLVKACSKTWPSASNVFWAGGAIVTFPHQGGVFGETFQARDRLCFDASNSSSRS